MADQNESKLPKWAQRRLGELRREVQRLKSLEAAYEILAKREWFTLRDHQEPFVAYRLCHDQAVSLCSIGVGDVLLVGRRKAVRDGDD